MKYWLSRNSISLNAEASSSWSTPVVFSFVPRLQRYSSICRSANTTRSTTTCFATAFVEDIARLGADTLQIIRARVEEKRGAGRIGVHRDWMLLPGLSVYGGRLRNARSNKECRHDRRNKGASQTKTSAAEGIIRRPSEDRSQISVPERTALRQISGVAPAGCRDSTCALQNRPRATSCRQVQAPTA